LECGLELGLEENGFAGGGSLEIPGTSIGADITFHYFKVRNGVDMGASFVVGAPIPIGAITIAKVGAALVTTPGITNLKCPSKGKHLSPTCLRPLNWLTST